MILCYNIINDVKKYEKGLKDGEYQWNDLIDPVTRIQFAVDSINLKYSHFFDENTRHEFQKIVKSLNEINIIFDELRKQKAD